MWKRTVGITIGASSSALLLGGYIRHKHHYGMIPQTTTYANHNDLRVPTREEMVKRLKGEHFDLVVIGGGATGASVALDASTRGLKCALVEGDDFGSGTSSRSTKLLHGGVRYLELAFKTLDLGQLQLVWEALEERSHLLHCAPYMSKPVPIVIPIYAYWQVIPMWTGIKLYDWMSKLVTCFDTGVPDCFYISRANAHIFCPYVKTRGLKGAVVYYDGQHNDARMNITIALNSTIADYIEGTEPAAVANHCRVTKVLKDDAGKVIGVSVLDNIKNEEFDVFGKIVVNCTGPGSDVIRRMADPTVRPLVTLASGSHAVLPKFYTASNFGMLIPKTSDGRVLFLLPWEGTTIVGTTDERASLTELPAPTIKEVDWLIKEASTYLNCDYASMRKNVQASWSGLRALVVDPKSSEGSGTSRLSRSHEIVEDPSALVSVMGGKWTTARKMAQDTVDYIVKKNKTVIEPKRACRTKHMKLYPAIDVTGLYASEDCDLIGGGSLPRKLQDEFNLTLDQASHLVRNYGFLARQICQYGKESNLLVPIQEGRPYVKAEILYAVRYEMAQTCLDVLARRMRLAFVDSEAAKKIVVEVAEMMAAELKWTPKRRECEVRDAMAYLDTMNVQKAIASEATAACPIKREAGRK